MCCSPSPLQKGRGVASGEDQGFNARNFSQKPHTARQPPFPLHSSCRPAKTVTANSFPCPNNFASWPNSHLIAPMGAHGRQKKYIVNFAPLSSQFIRFAPNHAKSRLITAGHGPKSYHSGHSPLVTRHDILPFTRQKTCSHLQAVITWFRKQPTCWQISP